METFVTVVVLLAMVAVCVLLIHLLNNQHDERITAFPYGRSRPTVRGPAPPAPRKASGRAGTSGRRSPRPPRRGTRTVPATGRARTEEK